MKPQGFGFAEYDDPGSAQRAIDLLNGVELPALEDGCVNKNLLVRFSCTFPSPSNLLRKLGKAR